MLGALARGIVATRLVARNRQAMTSPTPAAPSIVTTTSDVTESVRSDLRAGISPPGQPSSSLPEGQG